MALEGLVRRLDRVINLDVDVIISNILRDAEFQRFIIDLNTEEQLFDQGIDSLGASLGDYAATTIEGTANFEGKKDKGQRFDHITLKDTGDFYKSFAIKVQNGGFLIVADGRKEDTNLLEEYGKEILGLTDGNLQIVIDAIKEKLIPIILAAWNA
jgi:hypothetical protein